MASAYVPGTHTQDVNSTSPVGCVRVGELTLSSEGGYTDSPRCRVLDRLPRLIAITATAPPVPTPTPTACPTRRLPNPSPPATTTRRRPSPRHHPPQHVTNHPAPHTELGVALLAELARAAAGNGARRPGAAAPLADRAQCAYTRMEEVSAGCGFLVRRSAAATDSALIRATAPR